MNKIKSNLKKCLAYVVSRRLLKYSLIIVLFILPVGTALINKYFYNKETIKHELVESPNNKNNDNKGTIKTDVIADPETSIYTLNDGYTDAVIPDNSNEDSLNNNINSSSSVSINIDKSSLVGIDIDILEGDTFNPKKDLKLKATDRNGMDISENIIIQKNTVNTKVPGTYAVVASVRLSNGQLKEKEFVVTVKETRLDVVLESFKPVKDIVQKEENIVFDIDLKISKKHINPTMAMINGKEYVLYDGEKSIFDNILNKKRYKAVINSNDISGVQKYNLEHIKMSNGSWISLGDNVATVEVLKEEATIKNFIYEEQSINKILEVKFNLDDVDNTASNLRLELYKDEQLIESKRLNKKLDYVEHLNINSNGIYSLKILADINLNQSTKKNNILYNKEIFSTNISISNINQSSLTGENKEIIQGDKFDPIQDLSLKATDFDGEDITNKIVIEGKDIDTNIVGKYSVKASVVNKYGQKYNEEFYVNVNPIAEVIEFNPIKNEFKTDENILFEITLNMKNYNIEADKVIINNKKVNLLSKNIKNSISKTKTYIIELNPETLEGNKEYAISKVIMNDGKEFNLDIIRNIEVLPANTNIDSNSMFNLSKKLLNSKKESKFVLKNNNTRDKISGNEGEILNQEVTINGSINKSDGSAPQGKLEVELPTYMAFSVDQNGVFTSGSYTIKNKSSVGISVSLASFKESNPRGGINIRSINDSLSGLGRSDMHIALVGDKNYADLGVPISTSKELLDIQPLGIGIVQLLGEAGKDKNKEIDEKGVAENFNLVFSIKKKN